MRIIPLALALLWVAFGCKSKQMATTPPPRVNMSAPVIVYKTRSDYTKNIPVTLSEDKSAVVAYPAPGDIYYNGQLAYPTALVNGYWLDNRGIGPNTAFLKLTYQEYSQLAEVPSLLQLYSLVMDKDPFTEMYQAGYRADYKDIETELNSSIKKGSLTNFKKLK